MTRNGNLIFHNLCVVHGFFLLKIEKGKSGFILYDDGGLMLDEGWSYTKKNCG